jgi:hypothetical protein
MKVQAPAVVAAFLILALPALAGCMQAPAAAPGVNQDSRSTPSQTGGMDMSAMANMTNMSPNATNLGDRPHIHDYWLGRTRVVLASEDVKLSSDYTFDNVFGFRDASVGGAYYLLPKGETVYEGTGKMDITVDWTDPGISGLSFVYMDPTMPDWSQAQVLTKGQPLEMTIKPSQTDLPHSGASRWQFYFKGAGSPSVAYGTFHLKIEIVRVGNLTLFPAHPNFFGGGTSLLIMDCDTTSNAPGFANQIADFVTNTKPQAQGFTLPSGRIVPPETVLLTISITPKDTASQVRGISLAYRSTNRTYDQAKEMESPTKGTFNFRVGVTPDDVDSYYANSSQWRFYAYPYYSFANNGSVPSPGSLTQFCSSCSDQSIPLHVTIRAYNTDPFLGKNATSSG